MSTFDDLAVGEEFETPSRVVDAETIRALIAAGGYTHPLFTDEAYAAASPLGATPLPGQALLLLMGGLVEQSGRFDRSVIALTGLDQVRFVSPALAGRTIRVRVEVTAKEPSASGRRGTLAMVWRCVDDQNELLAELTARMLFDLQA